MRLEIADGWVDLDRPRAPSALLVLTHGAAGAVGSVDVLAVRAAALDAGIAVALVTQPFRVAGRTAPPKPEPQDEAWVAMLIGLRRRRGLASLPLVTGGRSNGARVACRTATAIAADAVVALAFPLHPPGKPEKSRLDELALPQVPVLVVQGDRDPFGLPPAAAGRTVVVMAGGDHGLRKDTASVARAVVEFVTSTAARANLRG
jgi:predicted alpha/beta-hydrolase family hydrolase